MRRGVFPIPFIATLGGGGSSTPPALVQYASQTVADGSQAAVAQVLTNTIDVPTTITGSGNVNLTVQAMGFNGGVPLVVPCALTSGDDTTAVVGKIDIAIEANATFTAFFTSELEADIAERIIFLTPANNDLWASFTITPTTATGINASSSTIARAGNAAGCQADFVGCLVAGAGTAANNGIYPQLGMEGGKSFFNLVGNNPFQSSIFYNFNEWDLTGLTGTNQYIGDDAQEPWLAASWAADGGDSPAPTVSPISIPCTAGDQVFIGISYDSSATIDTAVFVGGGAGTLSIVVDGDNNEAKITNGDITTAWYRGTATGGETGVQFIIDSAVRISIQAVEFSGVSSAAAEDTESDFSPDGEPNDHPSTRTITPTSASNLILAIVAEGNDAIVSSPAGFTSLSTVGGTSIWQETVYKIQSASDAQEPDWLLTGDQNWAACGAALGGA